MKEVKLDVKEIKISLGADSCVIREPTLRESESFSKKQKESGESLDSIEEFLVEMGMTKVIFDKLSVRNLQEIMQELLPQEKK